jgi:hydroxymethylpyrimidine pyrophosphatase-like HAD family hydrolase
MLGIDPQRVLAIGDNDNDIPLLQAVGFGVGMGNGTPGLKAVADWVAPPLEQDGAAVALRRWVLGE